MGGGIHHHVRRGAGDQRLQLFGAVEIRDLAARTAGQQAIARGGNDLAQRREAALQLGADLPVRAEQQDPPGAYTGSRSAATSASSGARKTRVEGKRGVGRVDFSGSRLNKK